MTTTKTMKYCTYFITLFELVYTFICRRTSKKNKKNEDKNNKKEDPPQEVHSMFPQVRLRYVSSSSHYQRDEDDYASLDSFQTHYLSCSLIVPSFERRLYWHTNPNKLDSTHSIYLSKVRSFFAGRGPMEWNEFPLDVADDACFTFLTLQGDHLYLIIERKEDRNKFMNALRTIQDL